MELKTIILGMLAETSIHPGSGQDAGFVDLPVAREAATDYPVIVGSSMKGALLDRARRKSPSGTTALSETEREDTFGKQEAAGQLLVGDARLVLLPVRSLHGSYRWVTCPQLLRRLQRDRMRAGEAVSSNAVPDTVTAGQCLASAASAPDGKALLEERSFDVNDDPGDEIVQLLRPLLPNTMHPLLDSQLVILSDDDFAWFARYGLAINARNQLNIEKKTSKNLWYEETLPPDSVFYCVLSERDENAVESVLGLFRQHPYLQVGGNETIGQGWFRISNHALEPATAGGAA